MNYMRKVLKIAIEGCCHGELNKIYEQVAILERKNAYKVDVLLICGDFQAIRNHEDLSCMAVPQKYKTLGGFHKYYVGEMTAPILTIVIGGNHEASNYMWELYHGGWLAPNIYFLGFSGCVQVNGVRIAGSSGIYKLGDYYFGHHEKLPYDRATLRSIYHVRQYDVFKLAQLSSPTIFLSHDWPNTIERYGNTKELLRRKPFFRQETQTGSLGSPPMLDLLKKLKPNWWFSAHLHVKFEALYRHDGGDDKSRPSVNPDEIVLEDFEDEPPTVLNPDEINIDDDDELGITSNSHTKSTPVNENDHGAQPLPSISALAHENTETRFLALDKCLPNREYLRVVDIPVLGSSSESCSPLFTFDPEWLAITRALHPFLCTTKRQVELPKPDDARALVAKELHWVRENVPHGGMQEISEVQTFWRTAPGPDKSVRGQNRQPRWYTNPQTEALMQMLQLSNKVNPVPTGTLPPKTQGFVSPDAMENIDEHAAQRNAQIMSPGPEVHVNQESMQEPTTHNEGTESSKFADSEPISRGGWSPSRMME